MKNLQEDLIDSIVSDRFDFVKENGFVDFIPAMRNSVKVVKHDR